MKNVFIEVGVNEIDYGYQDYMCEFCGVREVRF